jgi:hypothetical protein
MPDESSASESVGADRPGEQPFAWSAANVVENGEVEAGSIAPGSDAREEAVESDSVTGEGVQLDLASQDPTAFNGDSPVTPSSDRAAELESDHWRERAIVWRERAMAAELVAKMLQRNLDDVRANLEDLRGKVDAAEAAEAERTAAIAAAETPLRRFARDMYDKYLR